MPEQRMVPSATPQSYYGRPVLKRPVWRWPIPAYLFSGGLAGASSVLGLAARMSGRSGLARRAEITALASILAGTGFLVDDLGRPARFANMLRVFRPSSPMNVGSWLLAAYGPAAGAAAACDVLGILPAVRVAGEIGAAALGPAIASYTSVLVADTAVPVWHEAHRELPFVFVASAAATAGAAALLHTPTEDAAAARRLTLIGTGAEIAATRAMERRLGALAEPYHTGLAGTLARVARGSLGLGAAVVATAGRRRRGAAAAGGALVLFGSMIERFAIFHAGLQSAADPKYVVGPQRERAADRA